MPKIQIISAESQEYLAIIRELFSEYIQNLRVNLDFQDFTQELNSLPGVYSSPNGFLILAFVDEVVAGCCALRPFNKNDYQNSAEIKRLYVRPIFRGLGIGLRLIENILDKAKSVGYSKVLLDTLDKMEVATNLYKNLGFREIEPYYYNPLVGAKYFKLDLIY